MTKNIIVKHLHLKLVLSLFIGLFIFNSTVISQPWTDSFPKNREEKAKLTIWDYQKSFNDYWESYNVENGYYIEKGIKHKAFGWNQFKRWEWYWEQRTNPKTGEFPKVSSMEVFNKYKLQNRGNKSVAGNWTSMNPLTDSNVGRVNCIAFNANDNYLIYVGTASGGIWKTVNGGYNWTAIGDNNAALGTCDIIVVPTDGDDILYLATGDPDSFDTYSVGVLKSTDGGDTWSTTGLNWTQSESYIINRLIIDPNNNSILYAATNDGVFKTTNAGILWTKITTSIFEDLVFRPGSSTILYGSTDYGEIHRTIDSGNFWLKVFTNPLGRRTMLAVSEDNYSRLYAVMADENNKGLFAVYKSVNSGSSFSPVYSIADGNLLGPKCDGTSIGGQARFDLCIIADPNDADIVFVGGLTTWKSTNAGSSWNMVNGICDPPLQYTHYDKHRFGYQKNTHTLFECNDGGLYKSTNNGGFWQDISNNLSIGQLYRLGVSQTDDKEVIMALQDNGIKYHFDDTWHRVLASGDGVESTIDYTDKDIQYGSLQGGRIWRTINHWWGAGTKISEGISDPETIFLTPFLIDPNDHNTIYQARQDVWKSTNKGDTWAKISDWNWFFIRTFAIAPSNSQYIYVLNKNDAQKTTNGGVSWVDITSTLPLGSSYPTYVSIKDDDPNTAWVSFADYNNLGVFKTSDGGNTWNNISDGLPLIPVNCVIQNKLNTSHVEIYAATDVGVYVKIDNEDWVAFYEGLPNVVVSELEIYYDVATPENSRLRAATFGRGLWESDLWTPEITVISPDGGEDWERKSTHTIRWTDNIAENVGIKLYDNYLYHSTIALATSSDGNYRWTIPNDLQMSKNYMIRVHSINDLAISDKSNSYFLIGANTIPDDTLVQNKKIYNGETNCYDALNDIYIAGNETMFKVYSGGEAIFIAGNSISLNPGFKAYNGSHIHAYITTESNYCNNQQSMIASNDNTLEIKEDNLPQIINNDSNVHIYPNPTTGNFTINFMGKETSAEITVLNFQGTKIRSLNSNNQTQVEIDINYMPAGMYIIIIKTETEVIKKKIIKIK